MNELIKIRLTNVLKSEAKLIMESGEDVRAKLEKVDDIGNMLKIIDNYDELEPTLKKFFKEKNEKEKWKEGR